MWFLRMKRWVQNPPSWRTRKFVLGVLGICLVFYGIELIWGWPEMLSVERPPRNVLR